MVKMEAFDDPHMHQTVRVGHTDHTGSIVSLMACIFDLKKKFLCKWTLIKIVALVYVTVSGKTTLLAEIEKVGFLLPMDSINTRLCCGTSS